MNKSEIISMVVNKIKPTEQMYNLTQIIVENTIDILKENGLIDYSKEVNFKTDINSAANDKAVFDLVKKGTLDRR